MAVSLSDFKKYVRVDSDYEDDLLEFFLNSAVNYLQHAVSNYDEYYAECPDFAVKADLLTRIIATEFFQNRDNSAHSLSYTIQSMIVQLQYFVAGGDSSCECKES